MLNSLVVVSSGDTSTTDESAKKELFVDLVKKERCIWDIKRPYYKDIRMKRTAWEKIKMFYGGNITDN